MLHQSLSAAIVGCCWFFLFCLCFLFHQFQLLSVLSFFFFFIFFFFFFFFGSIIVSFVWILILNPSLAYYPDSCQKHLSSVKLSPSKCTTNYIARLLCFDLRSFVFFCFHFYEMRIIIRSQQCGYKDSK